MSKIICDVCGSSYADTATQCPICGCVRANNTAVVSDGERENREYVYTKGGRFSKANVRKLTKGIAVEKAAPQENKDNKKLIGLVIVLALLFVIVLSLVLYVVFGLIGNTDPSEQPNQSGSSQSDRVACADIQLSTKRIEFNEVGDQLLLNLSLSPVNTTDKPEFRSDNPDVAIVDTLGNVSCVGEGITTIIITCGDQTAQCIVNCTFETEPTLPTLPPEQIILNRKSIHADFQDYTWVLYSGDIPVDEIQWITDNPAVAVIDNGRVTVVGEGTTFVHAEYNGIRTSCEIIAKFEDSTEGSGITEGGDTAQGEVKLFSHYGGDALAYNTSIDGNNEGYDITINVGESVGLYFKDETGKTIPAEWRLVEGETCTLDGNYITANSSEHNCWFEAVCNGKTYKCYVRTANAG